MNYFTRILIVTVALLAGISVVVFAVAIPSIRGIVELRSKIEAERLRLEVAAAKVAAYRGSVSRLSEVQAELPKLEGLLREPGSEVRLFTELEALARAHKITQSISVGEGQASANVREIPLDLKLQGTFLDFFRYLIGLERMQALLAIRTLTLGAEQSKSAAQESPLLNVALHGVLYAQD